MMKAIISKFSLNTWVMGQNKILRPKLVTRFRVMKLSELMKQNVTKVYNNFLIW